MASSTTSFGPRTHGFNFANSFSPTIKVRVPLIGEIKLQNLMTGLCGGMCFTALDYFNKGEPIHPSGTVPSIGSRLHAHLVVKQIESMIPPDGVIRVLDWTSKSNEFVWRHTAGREFGKIQTRLVKGEPVVLALIRADRGEDPRKNHQVVAHAHDFNEVTGEVRIQIYDPNLPNRNPSISFNKTNPRHGIGIRQSPGKPLRGFFMVNYRPGEPPSLDN